MASPMSQGSASVQAPAVAPRRSHPHTTCSVQHTWELLSHPRLPGHGAETRPCALRPLGAQGASSAQGLHWSACPWPRSHMWPGPWPRGPGHLQSSAQPAPRPDTEARPTGPEDQMPGILCPQLLTKVPDCASHHLPAKHSFRLSLSRVASPSLQTRASGLWI